jgi:hypothetical protein
VYGELRFTLDGRGYCAHRSSNSTSILLNAASTRLAAVLLARCAF